MSRSTAILAFIQTLLVVTGFFCLGTVLKVYGYPDSAAARWNPLAVNLREYGAWLLMLPLLWGCFSVSAERLDRGIFRQSIAIITGICIVLLILVLFLSAITNPFTPQGLFPQMP